MNKHVEKPCKNHVQKKYKKSTMQKQVRPKNRRNGKCTCREARMALNGELLVFRGVHVQYLYVCMFFVTQVMNNFVFFSQLLKASFSVLD